MLARLFGLSVYQKKERRGKTGKVFCLQTPKLGGRTKRPLPCTPLLTPYYEPEGRGGGRQRWEGMKPPPPSLPALQALGGWRGIRQLSAKREIHPQVLGMTTNFFLLRFGESLWTRGPRGEGSESEGLPGPPLSPPTKTFRGPSQMKGEGKVFGPFPPSLRHLLPRIRGGGEKKLFAFRISPHSTTRKLKEWRPFRSLGDVTGPK